MTGCEPRTALQRERLRAGLWCSELGERAGVPADAIRGAEWLASYGRRPLTGEQRRRVAKVLQVHPGRLL